MSVAVGGAVGMSQASSSPPADNDTLVFIDFRADRMRQIVEALGIKPQFETDVIPKDLVSFSQG